MAQLELFPGGAVPRIRPPAFADYPGHKHYLEGTLHGHKRSINEFFYTVNLLTSGKDEITLKRQRFLQEPVEGDLLLVTLKARQTPIVIGRVESDAWGTRLPAAIDDVAIQQLENMGLRLNQSQEDLECAIKKLQMQPYFTIPVEELYTPQY